MLTDKGNDAFLAAADRAYQGDDEAVEATFEYSFEYQLLVGGIDVTGSTMDVTATIHGDETGWYEIGDIEIAGFTPGLVIGYNVPERAVLTLDGTDERGTLKDMLYHLIATHIKSSMDADIKTELAEQVYMAAEESVE